MILGSRWVWLQFGQCVSHTHTYTNSTVSRKVSPPWGGQMLRHWLTQTLTFAWRSGKWSSGKLHRLWWRRYTQLLQSVDTCWGQKQVTETVRFCLWTVRVFPFQPSRHDCGVFVVWTHDIFENMPDRWRAWLCVFADNKWKHFIIATCCRMAAITQCLLFGKIISVGAEKLRNWECDGSRSEKCWSHDVFSNIYFTHGKP